MPNPNANCTTWISSFFSEDAGGYCRFLEYTKSQTEFGSGSSYPNQHLAQGMTGCNILEGSGALGEWKCPVNDGIQPSLLQKFHDESRSLALGFAARERIFRLPSDIIGPKSRDWTIWANVPPTRT